MATDMKVLDHPIPEKSKNRSGRWKDQVLKLTTEQGLECANISEVSCARMAIIAVYGLGWATSRKLLSGKYGVYIKDPEGKIGKGLTWKEVRKLRREGKITSPERDYPTKDKNAKKKVKEGFGIGSKKNSKKR